MSDVEQPVCVRAADPGMPRAHFTEPSVQGVAADDVRRRLARDGYALVRGLLPRHMVHRTAAAMARVLAQHGDIPRPTSGESDFPLALTPLGREHDPASEAGLARHRDIYRLGEVHAVPLQAALRSLMASLYGEPVLHHPGVLPRVMFPAHAAAVLPTHVHQDFPTVQGSERTLTVWCALTDTPACRGGLAIASGRHREGVFPYGQSPRARFELTVDFTSSAVAGDLRAGDVLILTAFTPHWSLPNTTDFIRLSIDCRFQPRADPVSDLKFSDFCAPARLAWNELYEGSTIDPALRHYWHRLPLRLQAHSGEHDAAVSRAARAAARAGCVDAARYLASLDPPQAQGIA